MRKVVLFFMVALLFIACEKVNTTGAGPDDKNGPEDKDEEGGQVTKAESFVIIHTGNGDIRVDVEEASSPMTKAKGLTGVKVIEKGMFFIFEEEGDYAFRTVGMEVPIDIIFIGPDAKITDIKADQEPGIDEIHSDVPFQFVLETGAGFAGENNIEVGQTVDWFLGS